MGYFKRIQQFFQPFKTIIYYIGILSVISYLVNILTFFAISPNKNFRYIFENIVNETFWEFLTYHEIIIQLITMFVSLLIYYILYVKIYKKSYRDFFTKTLAYRNYVISFLIGVAFHLLLQGFFLTLSTFNPTSIEEGLLKSYTQHTNNFSLGNSLVIGLISLIILTPIFEEILFRGLVTHALRQNFSAKIYIPLQAFIFAILHMQLLHVFYTFILGLILGICYEKYKNILYPIFLHVGFNIFNIFLVTR